MATIQNLVGTNKIKDEWQKINDNFAALNGDISGIKTNLGGWRIYNDVTELGLTPGTETMEQIAAAMTNRSMLIYPKDGSNESLAYPSAFGMLIVTKFSNARVVFEFFAQSGGRPQKWIGYYASSLSPSFTGWSREALEYETGTWTPELQFGGASTGITYTDRFGRYTRIGNVVFWELDIVLSSKGTAIGDVSIAGLPFTSNNSRPYSNTVGGYANITLPSNATGMVFYIPNNSSVIFLRQIGNGIHFTQTFNDSHFANNSFLRAHGKYTI